MAQEFENEYAALKAFLAFYADRFLRVEGLPPEKEVMASVNALERKSARVALNGVRQAVNDCVEMSSSFTQAQVVELDSELRTRGLITLSEMRRRYSKNFAQIRKRGQIRSETEYYLVRNVLDDAAPKSPGERKILEEMILAYEAASSVR
jgi:hypothetical protein